MQDHQMTLLEHITELRTRLFRIIVALLVGALIGSFFTTRAIQILTTPAGDKVQIIAVSPTAPPMVFFKVALLLGLLISLPYILYQFYAFLTPGLLEHERKFLLLSVPGVIILFAMGVTFTMTVLIPLSVPVLMGFLQDVVMPTYTLDEYLAFVTTLLLWMGLLFQTPLVMYTLTRLGVVKPTNMRRARKMVIFLSAVVAAIITPTTDPLAMLLVTGPFIVLYEFGILLAGVALRQRQKPAAKVP